MAENKQREDFEAFLASYEYKPDNDAKGAGWFRITHSEDDKDRWYYIMRWIYTEDSELPYMFMVIVNGGDRYPQTYFGSKSVDIRRAEAFALDFWQLCIKYGLISNINE